MRKSHDYLVFLAQHTNAMNALQILTSARFEIQNWILMKRVLHRARNTGMIPGRVTILTPTYKRADRVVEAIRSAQAQTYENWEQMVVSDGYCQDTKDAVLGIGDERVRYDYTWPLHVSGNYQRNIGLLHASGEYVLYLDDDNILYPDALKELVAGFQSQDIGYVLAPIRYGEEILDPPYPFEYEKMDALNYMVRRDLVHQIRGQNRHYCADLHLIRKISEVSKGNRINTVIGHHR
jgi:glycosyltransferase involved in cell wall biosynthesis